MWGKFIAKAAGAASLAKGGIKYKLEVQVVAIDGLPPTVKYARVVMQRNAKVAHTKLVGTRGGAHDARRPRLHLQGGVEGGCRPPLPPPRSRPPPSHAHAS